MTPEQWFARLERRLREDQADIERWSTWYDGRQTVRSASKTCSAEYQRLLREAGTNWAALVVDAASDRLAVQGFRFGDDTESAWAVWQRSNMDGSSSQAFLAALIGGRAPLTVTVGADGLSRITVEDPREVILELGPNGERVAALKMFRDAQRFRVVELMVPGRLFRWRSKEPDADTWGDSLWSTSMVGFGDLVEQVGTDGVPVFELRANGRVGGSSWRSELAGREGQLRRIDKLTIDLMVTAEFGAFRQKWATGMELPDDGTPPFKAGVDRLFVGESHETRFGEFGQTDLGGYLRAREAEVTQLAAITKTPPHYLLSGMTNLSADAIRAAEASLVKRVERHQQAFSEPLEEATRFALKLDGRPAADVLDAETIWRKAETRTSAELADALGKLVASIGMPEEAAWSEWGATPQQIEMWRAMRTRDRLTRIVQAPVDAGVS